MNDNTFSPGPTPDTVKSADGKVLTIPDSWVLLPPGDAALTRRVKSAGDYWIVQEKKRREVRRMLARHSKELLSQYRRGEFAAVECPLQRTLAGLATGCESK